MELSELIGVLDASGHRRLQELVALGRWPDGRSMNEEERSACLQALIAFEAGLPEEQRSGYIAQRCSGAHEASESPQEIRITD